MKSPTLVQIYQRGATKVRQKSVFLDLRKNGWQYLKFIIVCRLFKSRISCKIDLFMGHQRWHSRWPSPADFFQTGTVKNLRNFAIVVSAWPLWCNSFKDIVILSPGSPWVWCCSILDELWAEVTFRCNSFCVCFILRDGVHTVCEARISFKVNSLGHWWYLHTQKPSYFHI